MNMPTLEQLAWIAILEDEASEQDAARERNKVLILSALPSTSLKGKPRRIKP
jgi:hypothetical protein